ncbi:MAG: GGDEF domain-containing protein [Pseudomonadota bacterium]
MGNRTKQTIVRGIGLTLISVTLSAGFMLLWYELDSNVTREDILTVAVLIPMICAPLCTYIGMKSRLKMDALALENKRMAETDPLTGLANRRAFFDHLAAEHVASETEHHPVAHIVCDVDNFKHFNDQHGHATGDAVLVHVAQLIHDALPQRAFVARIGGEEFAAHLNCRADEDEADLLAEHLVDHVANHPLALNGARLPVTISVGVFVGNNHLPPARALKAADEAMYAAKANGRNQYVLAA